MGRVVGIDLGTTNSVVAIMDGGKPLVIANSEGMRTTPSVVGFNKDGELVVGQMARRQAVLNPQNTFYGIKRFMGRRYAELNPESKQVPYTVRRDEEGNIKIKCPKLKKEFSPEEVSALILRRLAEEASRYLGEEVTGAVITVPAYFNDSQRQATRDAGRIAGLEVLRIINEPTAASLAYGLDQRESRKILVFDLGGGTFDVSILEVGDGVFEVKATSGDTQLGGNDFDKRIVDWLANQFLELEGVDLRKDRQALQRLTEAAEKAKIELSGVSVTDINLPFIIATDDGPKHIETRLTRTEFETLCGDLITRLRRPLKRALSDAGLTPVQIDEVVLVGGGTRMPMVQGLVRSFIDKTPNQNVNPDEVVAVGAAIQAGILGGQVKDILLLDVTPLSLGLETIGGVMKKLIPRNTTIPVRRSDIFSTGENNQTLVEIHVMQGEREMAADNKSLGRFKLTGIPPAPRGIPQIQVAFDIDANGILQVTARDKMTGREQSVVIQGASTLSESEIGRMLREAEEFSSQDRERRERVEKRNRAKSLADQAQRRLKDVTLDFGNEFTRPYRRQVETLCAEINESLDKNDETRLDRAQADLQDVLYEINREVRLQYEEDNEGFFSSIRKTLTGDNDDDYLYPSSRNNYRDDYPSRPGSGYSDYPSRKEPYRDDYPSRPNPGYQDSRASSNYRNDSSTRPNSGYSDRRGGSSNDDYRNNSNNSESYRSPNQDNYSDGRENRRSRQQDDYNDQDRRNTRSSRSRNIPPQNNWDDSDDDWF
ncbi:molecular chaperone DnaK [Aphanothece hegewaldii CCALA 016]|uniref:Chaperone protein DnaK n=1 Tax=Aphanothece hegewaldii CCALA 016 TaxID=2107694 RepID=A0A2T1M3G0_9CHRO|nr:molecular chaperone DnaK [Aphanothece hegewaldii]PSF39290.1 molecular chaperone DnaK [Aphanothece hegewaldii CCALA 016]